MRSLVFLEPSFYGMVVFTTQLRMIDRSLLCAFSSETPFTLVSAFGLLSVRSTRFHFESLFHSDSWNWHSWNQRRFFLYRMDRSFQQIRQSEMVRRYVSYWSRFVVCKCFIFYLCLAESKKSTPSYKELVSFRQWVIFVDVAEYNKCNPKLKLLPEEPSFPVPLGVEFETRNLKSS